eukprot:10247429-Lingulodinium_polyedra.AAC.1
MAASWLKQCCVNADLCCNVAWIMLRHECGCCFECCYMAVAWLSKFCLHAMRVAGGWLRAC